MSLINLIRIALKALQRNKLRALLTMLGIIIGVAAVIAMVAIGQGSKQSIHDQLSKMGTNMITVQAASNLTGGVKIAGSSFQTLTIKDIVALKANPVYITEVSPSVSAKGQSINGALNWPTTMAGVAPEYLDIRKLTIRDGIAFSDNDVLTSAKVCLIGQTVIDNLFPNGENPIGKVIRFGNIPFQVIGVLSAKGFNAFGQDQDDILIAPYTSVQKRILATIYYQNIYASAVDESVTDSAVSEMTRVLRTSHRLTNAEDNDFTVRTQQELIATLSSTSGLLTVLLTVIAGISLVIGGIGIMNIMYVSVTERTREIGLRMSIGARGKDILLQFLMEAILISLTGGVIGVLLGFLSTWLVTLLLKWPTVVSNSSVLLSFVVCALTGIFFGYYPAQKASRLDPIEALRYE
ncbi:ABC transporter permease [Mucilaginibacter gotjawali]|uniref:ABC transport system permease protein n=2 Tax=Mucilaginibacter gotjawali TaxID=1550579 RepID=A0A839SKR1_9SPHI|nr:ABC transporter permease [Mucilaginibacter gotjawali]MBB3057873.1 putative ABC transport system permease protein [Mucilaginibacter gotjawali]BAU52355.1 Macrolide export ATP-binding/permease protein MacB [Mucilaginibacter gotjawali]